METHYHKNLAALIQWLHFDSYFGIYKEHFVFFYILWGQRKKRLKLTIHYRKMDADCPVPWRMSVIVYRSTQVWKSARGHHLLLLLLTRTSTQLWCTSWTLTPIERSLLSFKLNPISTVCVSASDLCITLNQKLNFSKWHLSWGFHKLFQV